MRISVTSRTRAIYTSTYTHIHIITGILGVVMGVMGAAVGLYVYIHVHTYTVEPVLRDLSDERTPSDERPQNENTTLLILCRINLQ